jgi:hypothetical protein
MLDTIKINTDKAIITKQITVQDVYGRQYQIKPFGWAEMDMQEKRFIKQSPFIENTGSYYPSVTFRPSHKLYIEFSAPKILFDNNVDELSNADKDKFINQLGIKLFDMGISIGKEDLWSSNVSFATVSKNIAIEDIGATEFIEFTRRLWWKWRHSTKVESYEKNGIAIRKYTDSTGIGIYAKVPSLINITTKTNKELELSQSLVENNILRFEYRMQNYQRTLAKYSWAKGYTLKELRLKDIYDSELSKKILMYDLNKSLFSDEFKLISMQLPTIKKMYEHVMGKGLKPHEEMAVITAFRLCSDLGVNQAKEIFETRYSVSTTKRAWELCKEVFRDYQDYDYSNIRKYIVSKFTDFQPIDLSGLKYIKSPKQDNDVGQMKLI